MNIMNIKNFFNTRKQPSDTFRIGMLLSLVGGFVDAYTFVSRGRVFANAQTGNIIFFGLKLIKKEWRAAFFYSIPIFSFIIGIIIAEFIRKKFKNSKIHWRQIILLIEIFILSLCAFVPSGNLNVFVNTAISFICSLQVQTFRKTNGNISSTTMCTGNLRSGSEFLYNYLSAENEEVRETSKKNALIYFGLIFFFILGAVTGSFFSEIMNEKAVLLAGGILFSIFLIMFKDRI